MTRERAKQLALYFINKEIKEKGIDSIYCMAPQPGKNTWTCRECKEAIEQDKCMLGATNPIDDTLKLEKYLNERGGSLENNEEVKSIKW